MDGKMKEERLGLGGCAAASAKASRSAKYGSAGATRPAGVTR